MEMKAFLAYLRGEPAAAGIGGQIDEAMRQVKRHEKWREGYMKYEADLMDQRREGHAEGHAEGRAEGRMQLCDRMIRQGLPDDQIAAIMEVSAEEIALRRSELLTGTLSD